MDPDNRLGKGRMGTRTAATATADQSLVGMLHTARGRVAAGQQAKP